MSNWIARDEQVVWHPFTQLNNSNPLIPIVKGKGVLLYDEAGNEYIDAVSSWWTNAHGHANPYIQQKVSAQLATLEHVIFAGFTHPWAIEVAERVLNLLPVEHSKVFFSDNGSTAVEVGLKMAIQYWWNNAIKKTKIIAFEDAYHGDTVGAMSAGGRGTFTTPFESIMFDVLHLPVPNGDNNQAVQALMDEYLATNEVAAFIYEPMVQGSAGMIMYDVEGMNGLLSAAKAKDVILIADEVMTGFGRTGKLFASEYYSTKPDITCLSKALTGGTIPLSLTTCKQFIFEAFMSDDKMKTFFHGHSYTGNPTACAAAIASLDLIEKPSFKEDLARIGAQHQAFAEQLKTNPKVTNVRSTGTILAFEVVTGESNSYFNNIRDVLYNAFIERKVLLRPLGNTVYILPPFVITNEQLQKVYAVIEEVLEQVV